MPPRRSRASNSQRSPSSIWAWHSFRASAALLRFLWPRGRRARPRERLRPSTILQRYGIQRSPLRCARSTSADAPVGDVCRPRRAIATTLGDMPLPPPAAQPKSPQTEVSQITTLGGSVSIAAFAARSGKTPVMLITSATIPISQELSFRTTALSEPPDLPPRSCVSYRRSCSYRPGNKLCRC